MTTTGRPIGLRTPYAMSGTALAYSAALSPRYCASVCCYALSGPCAALREPMLLRSCYAMCGTDLGYAPTDVAAVSDAQVSSVLA
eukprot:1073852-Rhodomonas_salina.2